MNNTEPKHISEFILKWQKSLPQTMRSEFEYDTHALMNQKQSEVQPELAPAEPNSQVILDSSFDRDRFERMFCAVYQNTTSNFDLCVLYATENITKLDAYYASKEGGANE